MNKFLLFIGLKDHCKNCHIIKWSIGDMFCSAHCAINFISGYDE